MKYRRKISASAALCLITLAALLSMAPPGFCEAPFCITGPPVAESLAFAVMADRDLAGPGIKFIMWNSPDQARAMIASGGTQASLITTSGAATFYNKGIRVAIAGVFSSPLWVVSTGFGTETALTGTLLFPFGPGEMPELLFRAAMGDSGSGLATQHTGGALEAVNRLLMGKADHALLAEPAATLAVLRSRQRRNGPQLFKRMDMRKIWAERFDNRPLCVSAFGVFGNAVGQRERVKQIIKGYDLALEWIWAHPEQALAFAREKTPALCAQADRLPKSAGTIRTDAKAFEATQFFLGKIYAMDKGAVGGKLPGPGLFMPIAESGKGS